MGVLGPDQQAPEGELGGLGLACQPAGREFPPEGLGGECLWGWLAGCHSELGFLCCSPPRPFLALRIFSSFTFSIFSVFLLCLLSLCFSPLPLPGPSRFLSLRKPLSTGSPQCLFAGPHGLLLWGPLPVGDLVLSAQFWLPVPDCGFPWEVKCGFSQHPVRGSVALGTSFLSPLALPTR